MFNGILENGTRIIAEVKPWSPFGKPLTKNTWEEQLDLAIKVGWMISIHTHPLWKGSFDLIKEARKRTDKPILAKGFHGTDEEISRAIDAGADYVLVVGRIPKVHLERCFIEPLTLEELSQVPPKSWGVWNSRDLSSLKDLPSIPPFLAERWKNMNIGTDCKKESFQEARKAFRGLLCQASNIKTIDDIEPGADAVLVGSNLEAFVVSLGM